jgi:hypothetical protein
MAEFEGIMVLRMKRALACLLVLLSIGSMARAGAAGLSDIYSDYVTFLTTWYQADPNAGLTSFRSLLIPMGGLAEGMGQAYTAVSRDSSYFESNPAASSILEETEASFYHNNWIADTKIDGMVYTIRQRNFGLGFYGKWLHLEFPATNEYGDQLATGTYSEATAALNLSYNFFQGYNFSGLALGANLKGVYRSVRFNLLKFYHSRAKNCAFGLTLKNFGPPITHGATDITDWDVLPTVASAGLAYSPIKPLTLAFDFSKPLNLADLSLSEQPSYAFGVEGNVTDFFKLQGGILLKGGNPRISIGSSFLIDDMRLTLNYTLDLTTQLTPFNRVSVEASFALGDLGRAELAKKVDTLYLSGLEAYARGDSASAASSWKAALELDPRFDPAIESLRALEGTQQLLKKIDELQKLE